ncbi:MULTISPECIES: hypothetical protein [Haloferacaceae]|uniref:DUF8131 domain-containing protein n=1 Tax=Halorubrum glutamatedens TaxID=2707018 RepID=A0ABD5QMA5_9EURY|nr:hypothetical protein [Halobellus captivus]
MEFSLQHAVFLVLGGVLPAAAYIASRAEYVVAVTFVNVVLIWASLRIATGGSLRPGGDDTRLEPSDIEDA